MSIFALDIDKKCLFPELDLSEYDQRADIRSKGNGVENLYHENYKFCRHNKRTAKPRQRWSCTRNKSEKCRAAVSTIKINSTHFMKILIAEHTHESSNWIVLILYEYQIEQSPLNRRSWISSSIEMKLNCSSNVFSSSFFLNKNWFFHFVFPMKNEAKVFSIFFNRVLLIWFFSQKNLQWQWFDYLFSLCRQ